MNNHDVKGDSDMAVGAEISAVEQFLYLEARLLDTTQYEQWYELWDANRDIQYWIPSGDDDIDPMRQVSLVFDDRARLLERIRRLASPSAHSQNPRSRVCRSISNVEVSRTDTGDLLVHSNSVLGEFRRDVQTVYISHNTHVLTSRGDGGLAIVSKKVALVNLDGFIGNLTFIV